TVKHSNPADEVIARCQRLACFSEDEGGTRRTFLSPSIGECHREITRWMEPFGAQVRVDAAGNFRGFYPSEQSSSSRLILGSHLDTVPNAGAYDGTLGVVLRSEEHTSELQSPYDLVCRLLLEKKKRNIYS